MNKIIAWCNTADILFPLLWDLSKNSAVFKGTIAKNIKELYYCEYVAMGLMGVQDKGLIQVMGMGALCSLR